MASTYQPKSLCVFASSEDDKDSGLSTPYQFRVKVRRDFLAGDERWKVALTQIRFETRFSVGRERPKEFYVELADMLHPTSGICQGKYRPILKRVDITTSATDTHIVSKPTTLQYMEVLDSGGRPVNEFWIYIKNRDGELLSQLLGEVDVTLHFSRICY